MIITSPRSLLRLALRPLLAVLAAAAIGAIAARAAAPVRRPNFLFVYTDDQRWDASESCRK